MVQNIRLFKIFNRNILRLSGLILVFILISILVISPFSISYAERTRSLNELVSSLKSHYVIQIIDFEGTYDYNSDFLKDFIDYMSSRLNEYKEIKNYTIGFNFRISLKFDGRVEDIEAEALYPSRQVDKFLYVEIIEGSNIVGEGEVLIEEGIAIRNNLSVGDFVNVSIAGLEYRLFRVSGIFRILDTGDSVFPFIPLDIGLPNVIINYKDVLENRDLVLDAFISGIYLKFDEDFIVSNFDEAVQTANLIGGSIYEDITSEYDFRDVIQNNLLQNVFFMSFFQNIAIQIVTAFYSLPYLFGVWFLSVINLDLVIRSFRREFGLLMLRGLSNKQVRRYFLIYLFILSTLSLIVGIFVSPFFGNYILVSLGYESIPYESYLSPTVIILTFLVGYMVLIIAYYRRTKELKKISPIEASRKYYEPFERSTWSPSLIFTIFFILSIVKFVEWFLALDVNQLMMEAGALAPIIIVYSIISGFMNIFAPIILTYGIINITIYNTRIIPAITKVFSTLIAKPFKDIVFKYSGRLPGLTSKTTFLTTLLLSLMLYYMIFSSRTIYFYDSYNEILDRSSYTAELQFRDFKLNDTRLLLSSIEDLLDSYGYRDVFVALSVPGEVLYKGRKFDVSLVIYLDQSEFIQYFRVKDWLIKNADSPIYETVLANYLFKQIFEETFPIDLNDVEFDVRIKSLLPFSRESNMSVVVDGYLASDMGIQEPTIFLDLDNTGFEDIDFGVPATLLIISPKEFDTSFILDFVYEDLGFDVKYMSEKSVSVQLGFLEFFGIMQRSLYSYNLFAMLAVAFSISILAFEYTRDMIYDLLLMRLRGFGDASLRFAYSLTAPIIFFSIVVGAAVGLVAGYGASQQTISAITSLNIDFPIFIEYSALYYFVLVVALAGLIPMLMVVFLSRKYVYEVEKYE